MIVVKIGGAAGVDTDAVCRDVARLVREDRRCVVVHGGSDEANRLGEALGHPPRFVTTASGHVSRRTDRRTLEIFVMATAAVNRRLVSRLQGLGVDAIGLSGLDGGLVRAQRKATLRIVEDGRTRILRDDYTGRPRSVDGALLELLCARGLVPVIAPVALGEDGEALNVDADRVAARVAAAVRARNLLLLTNAPGLLREFPDTRTLVRHVAADGFDEALGFAEGRMKKKVLGAQEALTGGVPRVVIAGSSGERPLWSALSGAGTVFGVPVDEPGLNGELAACRTANGVSATQRASVGEPEPDAVLPAETALRRARAC